MPNSQIISSGILNSKPYYILNSLGPSGGFIFWNSGATRWEHTLTLGGPPLLAFLSGQTGPYPVSVPGLYDWIVISTNTIELNNTTQGSCPLPTPTPTPTPIPPTATPTPTPTVGPLTPTPTPIPPTPTPTPIPFACEGTSTCGKYFIIVPENAPIGYNNGLSFLNGAYTLLAKDCVLGQTYSNVFDPGFIIDGNSIGFPINISNPTVICDGLINPCNATAYPVCLCGDAGTTTISATYWIGGVAYDASGAVYVSSTDIPYATLPVSCESTTCRSYVAYSTDAASRSLDITNCCTGLPTTVTIAPGSIASPSFRNFCSSTAPQNNTGSPSIFFFATGFPCDTCP